MERSSEAETDLGTGMLVGIHGFQRAPALNGTLGVIYGFDRASHRYTVGTESGTIKKFKAVTWFSSSSLKVMLKKRSVATVLMAQMVMIG